MTMRTGLRFWHWATAAIFYTVLGSPAFAAPHDGDTFQLRQPDGTLVPVRVWGDEFHQDVESLQGYTVIRDEATGWITFADKESGGVDLVSTTVRYKPGARPPHGRKKLRRDRALVHQRKREVQRALGYDDLLEEGPWTTPARAEESSSAPVLAEPRRVMGLTLLVDFPDSKTSTTRQDVENFANQVGYSGGGNNGSIYDYFYDVSNGLLIYNNIVTAFVTVDSNKTYYDRGPGYAYAQEFITNALEKLQAQTGLDLTQLTLENDRAIALNILYAGSASAGWANGLWPHQGTYRGTTAVQGIRFSRYQITAIGTGLRMGTFVHENGHMVMRWADLYSYEDHSNGVGRFCIMNTTNATNPQQPNPYFRNLAGWIDLQDITGSAIGTEHRHAANSHAAFSYVRNDKEFYAIEARRRIGRSAGLPAEGLAIWHVHKDGLNKDNTMGFPMVALMQADGLRHLENRTNSGDVNDLFRSNLNARFNSNTTPAARWHDGGTPGIDVAEISAVSDTMSFRIGPAAVIPSFVLTVVDGEGSGTYPQGTAIDISADAERNGAGFLRWTSATLNISAPYTRETQVNIGPADATITARFQQPRQIPGTLEVEEFGYQVNTTTATNSDGGAGSHVRFATAGAFAEYVVDVGYSATYTFEYRVATTSTTAAIRIRNALTGEIIDSLGIAATGGNTTWRTQMGGAIALDSGRHIMRIELVSGTFNLNRIISSARYWLQVENGQGSGWYAPGETVSITANSSEASDSTFVRWSSTGIAPSQIYSSGGEVAMPASPMTLKAHFGQAQALPGELDWNTFAWGQNVGTSGGSERLLVEGESQVEVPITVAEPSNYRLIWRVATATGVVLVLRNPLTGLILDSLAVPAGTGEIQELRGASPLELDSGRAVWSLEIESGSAELGALRVLPVWLLTVTGGTGSGYYAQDEVASIEADPVATGATFLRWVGADFGAQDPYQSLLQISMPGFAWQVQALTGVVNTLPGRIEAENFLYQEGAAGLQPTAGMEGVFLTLGGPNGSFRAQYAVAAGAGQHTVTVRASSLAGGRLVVSDRQGTMYSDTVQVVAGGNWVEIPLKLTNLSDIEWVLEVASLVGIVDLDWIEIAEEEPIVWLAKASLTTAIRINGIIYLDLAEPSRVLVEIVGINGRLLSQQNLGLLTRGNHRILPQSDGAIPPGKFFYRLKVQGQLELLWTAEFRQK